jgi:branched-chain amino acid transport system ATP-binding protein
MTVAPILKVANLSVHFGGVAAVDAVDLELNAGEVLGVIGPNGAGKSTFVNLISGALRASAGDIHFGGERVTELAPDERARRGIARTHQIPRPFARMTVFENLALAARHARGTHSAAAMRRACSDILERTGLAAVADQAAGGLPLLRRKRLELARALALRPRLLLLDEIGAGLIESETRALIDLIQSIRLEVEGILLIEHVMDVVRSCCDRTAVLSTGRLLTVGVTGQVLEDAEVVKVYLGTGSTGAVTARVDTGASTSRTLLSARGLKVHYGGVQALRGVDIEVREGQVVALLGANGAGKTTLANAISGVVPLSAGTVSFAGVTLNGLSPDEISAAGLSHCMEGRRIFSSLTVEENLLLALPRAARHEARARLDEVYGIFPALAECRDRSGTAMSGGQQQMLAIARALMSKPRLVIFDEISLGLAPIIVGQLYATLERVRQAGVAMLLVEQDVERGLQLADRAYVLSQGSVRLEGAPEEIRNAPALRALYVGESE